MRCAQERERLSQHCTLGIGGPARYLVEVYSAEQLAAVIRRATSTGLPYVVLGKGSNTLFDDRGFDGFVILNCINFVEVRGRYAASSTPA